MGWGEEVVGEEGVERGAGARAEGGGEYVAVGGR